MVVGIIGAGPAGVACASILARYKIEVLLFEKREIGGLLNNARLIENFPGLPPISGKEFSLRLRDDIEKYHIPIVFENVLSVNANQIQTSKNKIYQVDKVVLATGTKPSIINEWNQYPQIAYEWRDLPDNFNSLAIYGAGDAAFDSGLRAIDLHKQVFIFNRSLRIKSIEQLSDQFFSRGGIYFPEEPILEIKTSQEGIFLITKNRTQKFDAFLVSIGREKNIDLVFSNQDLPQIGDLLNHPYRQASIAIGDGIRVGLSLVMQRNKKWK
jgi:thioredoxin reductase (NADPH)